MVVLYELFIINWLTVAFFLIGSTILYCIKIQQVIITLHGNRTSFYWHKSVLITVNMILIWIANSLPRPLIQPSLVYTHIWLFALYYSVLHVHKQMWWLTSRFINMPAPISSSLRCCPVKSFWQPVLQVSQIDYYDNKTQSSKMIPLHLTELLPKRFCDSTRLFSLSLMFV